MVTLVTCQSRMEAEVVHGLLAENGIQSWIFADDQSGMYPSVSFIGGVKVKVDEADLKQAQQLLESLESEADEP